MSAWKGSRVAAMMTLDEITQKILEQIDGKGFSQDGAFNLRHNGIALCHGDSEHGDRCIY